MPFSEEDIDSIRADCFANDVDYDVGTLAELSEEQIIEYFESGGETLPEGVVKPKPKPKPKPRPKPAADKNDASQGPALPPIEHRGARRLLCLHEAGACGEIMRRQLKPLGLEASFPDMAFLDGALPVDAAAHPDAKMLKAFYPTCANLQYMEKHETHADTRKTRVATLNYARPDDRVLWEINRDRDAAPTWLPSYVGAEAALRELSRRLASDGVAAAETGVVGFGQGATLVMMLLALLDAATDDGADRRRERLVPSCLVLISPT